MDTKLYALLELADIEFDGESFNGPSLMATLDGLTAAEAASEATFEGYSAWEIAIHCAYYKYLVAEGLDKADGITPYPYRESSFPPLPVPADEDAWRATRAYLRKAHHGVMKAIRSCTDAELEAVFPKWEISFHKTITWLCSHDIMHNGQIRSMGLASLRRPKER